MSADNPIRPGVPPDEGLAALIDRLESGSLAPAVMTSDEAELATALARPWHELTGKLSARNCPAADGDRSIPYLLYEPAGYDGTTARYPVLFHLHGRKPFTHWTPLAQTVLLREANMVAAALETAVAAGDTPPLLLVFPFGFGDTYWADSQTGDRPAWSDLLVSLQPHIDVTYRTVASAQKRLLQGYSMGGFGALSLAAAHPDRFSLALSFDGAFHNWASLSANRPEVATTHFANERALFEPFSPWIHLADQVAAVKTGVAIRLNVGEFTRLHTKLISYLNYLGIPFTEVRTGCDHDLGCLLAAAGPESFAWIGAHLRAG